LKEIQHDRLHALQDAEGQEPDEQAYLECIRRVIGSDTIKPKRHLETN